jgi:large subunit ribosomal protein L21
VGAFAVIKTGGKQLRVAQDDIVVVEKLAGEPGDVVSFGDVLMLADGKDVKVGAPTLEGVAVHGEIADQRRADKITIIKKKRRQTYHRKKGHRQHETVVRITALGGAAPKAGAKPKAKAETPKAKAEAAPKAAPETKAAAKGDELPVLFLKKPEGEADDLKKLSGVGPAIEKKLNAIGIYHFRQIAAFKKADIAQVDEVLNFKGRIEREDWVAQAKKLAKGEE